MKYWRSLVIEDDSGVRTLFREVLKSRDHEVIMFSAIEESPLLHKHRCGCDHTCRCADFIILDLYMDDLYGLHWREHQYKEKCRVPNVAMMSASWTKAEKQKAHELGCVVFDKPFEVRNLNSWLEKGENNITENIEHAQWFL